MLQTRPGWRLSLAAGLTYCLTASASLGQDWSSWGNGLRFERFAPQTQINRESVRLLAPVWKYTLAQKGNWEITPIVVKGTLYFQDMEGNAVALDPETGKEIWRFSSHQRGRMRAVSYWPGDKRLGPRIVMAVSDRIYALDAQTGKPSLGFGGRDGFIDVRAGFAQPQQRYAITSPPTIYKNLLITGPATQEFGSYGPPGDPRAYDVITGKLVWRFHAIPQPGEKNFGTWGEGWKGRSGPSAWGMISVDEKTGLAFLPIGNPADSYVGVDRPGDNLYANSVVAVEAATGRYRWHFQLVHHDLFDYDTAAAPALVDLTMKGRKVPALVEVSKQGLMFILDRRTGKPVFGVSERPVPQSTVPGEKTSPTQPFPIKPPPLSRMGMTREDITTLTPDSSRFCREQWDRLGLQDTAPFAPPRLNAPNIFLPGNVGGLGGVWGGVSIDPRTNTIFVNSNNLPAYSYIVPASPNDPMSAGGYRVDKAYTKLMDQYGMPCLQPPWAELIAVNGNTGKIVWRTPLGDAENYGELGQNKGALNLGGSLATAGGLLFIGGTGLGFGGAVNDSPMFRAYDSSNGKLVWSVRLSSPAESSPMSFVGKSGRQYIVVAESGSPRTSSETALIAFALPKAGEVPVDLSPAPYPIPFTVKTVTRPQLGGE